jgi:hypothetical protein
MKTLNSLIPSSVIPKTREKWKQVSCSAAKKVLASLSEKFELAKEDDEQTDLCDEVNKIIVQGYEQFGPEFVDGMWKSDAVVELDTKYLNGVPTSALAILDEALKELGNARQKAETSLFLYLGEILPLDSDCYHIVCAYASTLSFREQFCNQQIKKRKR